MRSTHGEIERDGGAWGWYEYRPFGGDVWHGGYRTRAAARRARRAVLEAHGAGYWADVWRAGRSATAELRMAGHTATQEGA